MTIAQLTLVAGYIPRHYTCPETVTHPSTNRARRLVTWFMRRTAGRVFGDADSDDESLALHGDSTPAWLCAPAPTD